MASDLDPLSEIFPSRNRTPSCEFQDFVAPIVNTPEKIRYYGCTPEPEPGCSRIVSAFGPDIAAQRGDTVVPETEVNIRQNTSRDNSLDPKPRCSASHCSALVLRPIPNPAKPMTTRERKLQKEDQKQKYEKNKVKNVTKRLNDKSKNVPKKTNTKTDKDKKTAKKNMMRNYKRKTTWQSWSEEATGETISAVIVKKMGCRKAAATFGVPQTMEKKGANEEAKS
ncbi:hypothetical protein FQA39_LY15004 [Lamprigera yunnana]|nr:hypothetical protein FQA39_LY15004 [Lamprigera yunnana]